jgi:hypothetical protein
MPDAMDTASDLEIPTPPNPEYLASTQNADGQRYEQIPAGDFTASLSRSSRIVALSAQFLLTNFMNNVADIEIGDRRIPRQAR